MLTSDEKFVILSTVNQYKRANEICVMDIQDDGHYLLWGGSFSIPCNSSSYKVTKTGGFGGCEASRLLVSGWMRELFASQEFEDSASPPSVVVKMIAQRTSMPEMIHWIADNSDLNHFVLSVQDILSSTNFKLHIYPL